MSRLIGASVGLRERKKLRTRQAIADAAKKLFLEHGFERVSVAEVARAADVSEQTVFNYFPTKEDLVYERSETFRQALVAAVRDRPDDEPVVRAFVRFIVERSTAALAGDGRRRLLELSQLVSQSASLMARERQIVAEYTDALAGLLAEERRAGPQAVEPRLAAEVMISVHRSLVDLARRRASSRISAARLAAEIRAAGERCLALLEGGLSEYGKRAGSHSDRASQPPEPV